VRHWCDQSEVSSLSANLGMTTTRTVRIWSNHPVPPITSRWMDFEGSNHVNAGSNLMVLAEGTEDPKHPVTIESRRHIYSNFITCSGVSECEARGRTRHQPWLNQHGCISLYAICFTDGCPRSTVRQTGLPELHGYTREGLPEPSHGNNQYLPSLFPFPRRRRNFQAR
jgi:hypothetical protein